MSNTGHRKYAAFWCTVLFSCLWWLRPSFDVVETGNTAGFKRKEQAVAASALPSSNEVVLVPGELPGYTGWGRLEDTLAGSFRITSRGEAAVVGKEWNLTVECKECHTLRGGSAHFYARAYGPAVLAGNVHDINSTSYMISFLPMDPGSYTVEVVLISSGAPSWNVYPLETEDEPSYEGFLLPGFPLTLHVPPVSLHVQNRSCAMSDLLSQTTTSAYHKARWVMVDKLSHPNHVMSSANVSRKVTFDGYVSGLQSLGIFMDYRHQDCVFPSFRDASVKLTNYAYAHKNMHVILIGDSTMRLQSEVFESTFPDIQMTYICTSGGIVELMPNVTSGLQAVIRDNPKNQRRFILFNTGLHDVGQLCSRWLQQERRAYIKQPDSNFSCSVQYRESLSQLADFISQYPAELRIFMSTSAGWMRYGNFGFEWPSTQAQSLVLSSNMVAHFNEIAYQVMQSPKNSIRGILDAYWVTLARPDNREIGRFSMRGKHLVHPGKEVLYAMVRNWVLVLLEHLSMKE